MTPHILDLDFLGSDHTIASFLVETSEGPVLIESGPHSTLDKLKAELEKRSYRLSDVRHVLLTHIHLDHAGGAWAVAREGAQIYVHPVGAPHLIDPSRLMSSAGRIYQDQMDYLWGQMQAIPVSQVTRMAHGQKLEIGDLTFTSWHTPGHATHHIAWQLEDKLFTGDVAGVKIGDGPVVPPCPPPDINLEDWENSIRLIRKLAPANLFLTHFGMVTDQESHLNALHKRLWEWADWIRPHYEAGRKPGEITGEFQDYVEQGLRAAGADDKAVEQYQKANPAFMSVAGLMRYWRKRAERALG